MDTDDPWETGPPPVTRQTALRLWRAGRIEELRKLADAGAPQGCRQLAVLLARTGQVAELRARVADGDRYARRQLADWLVRQQRLDEAIEVMRPLAESGHTRGARRRLARLLAGRGRVEEAAAVVRLDPGAGLVLRARQVPAWFASQGRVDLLQLRLAAGGPDIFATQRLMDIALEKMWPTGRLTEAVHVLTALYEDDSNDVFHFWLMHHANDYWRGGRLHLRTEAIDLLAAIDHPLWRRVRAGLLRVQSRREEAIAELRSLANQGDEYAGQDLAALLHGEQPVRELWALNYTAVADPMAVAFSPDGTMLATGGGTIVVWHAHTGEHLHTLRTSADIRGIAFSPDGTLLASFDVDSRKVQKVQLWNPVTGELRHEFGGCSFSGGVAFSADGALLIVGGTVLDPATGQRLFDLSLDAPDAVASPDNRMLATVGGRKDAAGQWDQAVRLWNLSTGELVRELDAEAYKVAFSPDSRLLACAGRESVWLVHPTTGERIRRLGDDRAHAVAFHPGGSLLAITRRDATTTGSVQLWNVTTGELVHEIEAWVNAIAFSPDGTILATADMDEAVVKLWDIEAFNPKATVKGYGASAATG